MSYKRRFCRKMSVRKKVEIYPLFLTINNLEAFLTKHGVISLFVFGTPENLSDYCLFLKNPKYRFTKVENRLGAINPRIGNMDVFPNPYIMNRVLGSEPSPGNENENDPGKSDPGIKSKSKPGNEPEKS